MKIFNIHIEHIEYIIFIVFTEYTILAKPTIINVYENLRYL